MSVLVPVHSQPRVVIVSTSTHGQIPVQRWRITGLWGLHLYKYSATLVIDGEPNEIHYGYASWTPPGSVAEYHFHGPSTHLFAHIEWPSDLSDALEVPLVAPLGTAFQLLWDRMAEAVSWPEAAPSRATARIWDAALEVASLMCEPVVGDVPSAVRQALSLIEQRLDEPISVASLADEVSISHNHLTRLFRQSTGKTITESIQELRVDRARHLLEHSDLPIKQIAALVGLSDLQQFNKTMRKHLGLAPSAVRAGARHGGNGVRR